MFKQHLFLISLICYCLLISLLALETGISAYENTLNQPDTNFYLIAPIIFLLKTSVLLLFIPAFFSRNLKSLSWLAYVSTIYLIYAIFQLFATAGAELNNSQLNFLQTYRLLALPMSATLLILFYSLVMYVRQQKVILGLIIEKSKA